MLNITMKLMRAENASGQVQEWWIVNQTEPGPIEKRNQKYDAGLEVYVFSDQVSPPSLGFLAGYGYVKKQRYSSSATYSSNKFLQICRAPWWISAGPTMWNL